MSRVDEAAPDASHSPQDSPAAPASPVNTSRLKLTAIVSGLLGLLMFCLIPLLPVQQVQSSYSWPQGGDLQSVTSPLVSYQAQDLDITIPVSEVRDLNNDQTTVLSTVPEDSEDQTLRGLFVRSTANGLDVINRNSVLLSIDNAALADLPSDAVLRISSSADGTRAWVPDATDAAGIADISGAALETSDGAVLTGLAPDDMRPMLTGIYTEMTDSPENTQAAVDAGLKVDVTIDSRFTSSPSAMKIAAAVLGLIFAVISLVALHRIDRLDGRTRTHHRFLPANWWRPRWLDGVVGGILLIWYFI